MATAPAPKPRLSFWQIWNMSFGFLGIQFGFALQNANVSRIFETLGADVDQIPILWIAAPLTGLIVQPIIGYMSDRTWGKLGRRRPYFLIGAILASIALLIMPNSPVLWVAAGMLWIMDASINVSMEPFRAFVGDNLPDEQRTQGFAMQSFFIGTGAVVASALPYLLTNVFGVANTAGEGGVAPSVTYSFYIGGAVFFVAVLWTVLRSREYSPDELAAFEAWEHQQAAAQGSVSGEGGSGAGAEASGSGKTAESARRKGDFEVRMKTPPPSGDEHLPEPSRLNRLAAIWALGGLLLSLGIYQLHLGKKELYIVGFGALVFGLMLAATAYLIRARHTSNGFVEVISDLLHMPKTMKQLAVVQFFSWFALFAMWIYSTSAVSRHYYDMNAPASISAELLPYVDALPAEQQAEMRESLAGLKPLRRHSNDGTVYVPLAVTEAFLKGP
jgi:maltose/moltooligosaccharide transporter